MLPNNISLIMYYVGTTDEFDPSKRASKTIVDHLDSVRELGLSRDSRRLASRESGISDNSASKRPAVSTPVTNTSLVNVSYYRRYCNDCSGSTVLH